MLASSAIFAQFKSIIMVKTGHIVFTNLSDITNHSGVSNKGVNIWKKY